MVSNIFMFTPIWGRYPFWLTFFRWVGSTTNQICVGGFMLFFKTHLLCLGKWFNSGCVYTKLFKIPLVLCLCFWCFFTDWDSMGFITMFSPLFGRICLESKAKQGRENRPVFAKGFGIWKKKAGSNSHGCRFVPYTFSETVCHRWCLGI